MRQPSWITTIPAEMSFGFDDVGLWFFGDADGYPVRTSFSIADNITTTIIFTFIHDSDCADQGICVFRADDTPVWDWEAEESRIAFSMNCPKPNIYGLVGEVEMSCELITGTTYTGKMVYDPAVGVTCSVYIGDSIEGELLCEDSLNEVLASGNYKVGFSADLDTDEEADKSYFTFFSVNNYTSDSPQITCPVPTITFRVNMINYEEIFSYLQPGSLETIIYQLRNAVVWIEFVGRPLKHGDEFTLCGEQALKVKNNYIGQTPRILEIV